MENFNYGDEKIAGILPDIVMRCYALLCIVVTKDLSDIKQNQYVTAPEVYYEPRGQEFESLRAHQIKPLRVDFILESALMSFWKRHLLHVTATRRGASNAISN